MNHEVEYPKLKDLYAYLGYAVFLSQSLEELIKQGWFTLGVIPKHKERISDISRRQAMDEWNEFVDKQFKQMSKKTLGTLLKLLHAQVELPEHVSNALEKAVTQRNYLAHEFFKEKLAHLYSDKGQDDAIEYLQIAGGQLMRARDLLMPIVYGQMEEYGYDKEFLEQFAENAIASAQSGLEA